MALNQVNCPANIDLPHLILTCPGTASLRTRYTSDLHIKTYENSTCQCVCIFRPQTNLVIMNERMNEHTASLPHSLLLSISAITSFP
ncbi:hypothetical protein V5799_027244 [Amblyomma americanum]|uniref:Uncharacterized protein n=1 Tax=Amblyomma americanum TaxID=6943 RepID=A0AAQ4DG98_AMBAM